jgi:hypothetical protein
MRRWLLGLAIKVFTRGSALWVVVTVGFFFYTVWWAASDSTKTSFVLNGALTLIILGVLLLSLGRFLESLSPARTSKD